MKPRERSAKHIDCAQDERPVCNHAFQILKEKGFSRVALLVR